ncbi:hybrid sensor histidine kinase/response regulator [Anaerostipes sp.]|uniref:hybrid sensor histidine kinase/response regulator n=1 Tax=Anaerostipes sp. TaxID=1872530 RepID=UPI0025BA57D3|nr:hybrid sensor histidine kinase/response regulator [Anaerostipes sp.]MBS7008409.1 response regulator [Anaerostipes sp.]
MKKNKMKISGFNKKVICCLCGAILVLTVLFISAVFFYFRRFDQTLEKENKARLSETAQQITSHALTIVEDTKTSLEISADALASIEGKTNKLSYLSEVRKKPGIAFIGYADKDGTLWTPDMKHPDNVSREPYFIDACRGKTAVTDVQRRILEDKAVSGITFCIPVAGEYGHTDGALIAMLDIKKLQDALSISSFNGNGYAYLIDAGGELILRTKSMDYNNYFRVLENDAFSGDYSLAKVKEDIKHHRKGMTLYEHLGMEQYAYYQPLGMNDWTIVNIVSKDTVSANTAVLTKELAMLSVSSVAVFAVLLTMVVVSLAVSKNQQHIAEMKSAFLANMSHEIRTPMNAVTGVSELLLREELSAKQREYVETIDRSSRSLLVIINDILDYSKIESGKFTLMEEEYSLRSLIADITALTVLKIGEKPVHFYVDLDRRLPARLYGDITRVKQIMVNLLGNAVKFTEKGYICLHLSCRMEHDNFQLMITVEDTGTGIRKQDMHRLFNSFEQIDTHYSHSSEGTGLGLAISKNLAEMMGGGISVESVYGKGSSFSAVICQRPLGDEKLVHVRWPQGGVLAVYEANKDLCVQYQKSLEEYRIPCQIESDQLKFLEMVSRGTYEFILADQETLSMIDRTDLNRPYESTVLLHQKEDPYGYEKPAVYSPLFCLGLEFLMDSGKKNVFRTAGQFDISMVHPFPEAKILIVDDNQINLGVAEALMDPYQMQIDCASSGKEAVQAVKRFGYDLIFLDHMMPEMDGIETLKAIRALPDPKNNIPVIALTANVTKEAQELFKKEGFDGFMPKPVDIRLLDEILMKYLSYAKE